MDSSMNNKAIRFSKYLSDSHFAFFKSKVVGGDTKIVVFYTSIPASQKYHIPGIILTDTSLYTVARIYVGKTAESGEERQQFLHYANKLNAEHATFKIYATTDGHVFIDCVCPSTDAKFDPRSVHLSFNLMALFLQEGYDKLLTHLKEPVENSTMLSLKPFLFIE